MITPALVAWVAAQLAHAETGVNVLRLEVPRGGDKPAPPPVQVFDAVADDEVARRAPPEPTPNEWVLYVSVGDNVVLAGQPSAADLDDEAIIVVELAGATAQSNNALTMASAHRLMRCVRRCLFQAFRAIQASDMPRLVLDKQRFTFPPRISVRTQEPVPGSGRIHVVAIAPFTATDNWA
jgi:hypothetical protein